MSSTKKAQQLSWMQYCNWFIFREDCEISHHQEGLRLARRGHRRWLTVFYISDKKKTRRVQCQRCYTCVAVCWEVCSGQPYQRQPKDPRVSEEKHCQSQAQEGCHLLFWERLSQCYVEGSELMEKDRWDCVQWGGQVAAGKQFFSVILDTKKRLETGRKCTVNRWRLRQRGCTWSHLRDFRSMVCHRVLCWAQFSSSSTQNLFLPWFSVTPLSLLRMILSSKFLSLHRTFNLQYLLWKLVSQTSRPGCWKTNLNLTRIGQKASSCAHLPSPFQFPNILPSRSVAVNPLFLLLPEILVSTSQIIWVLNCTWRTCADRPTLNFAVSAHFGIFFPFTLQTHLCPPLSSLG